MDKAKERPDEGQESRGGPFRARRAARRGGRALRARVQRRPDRRRGLGQALRRPRASVATRRRVLRAPGAAARPNLFLAHHTLGVALQCQGRLGEPSTRTAMPSSSARVPRRPLPPRQRAARGRTGAAGGVRLRHALALRPGWFEALSDLGAVCWPSAAWTRPSRASATPCGCSRGMRRPSAPGHPDREGRPGRRGAGPARAAARLRPDSRRCWPDSGPAGEDRRPGGGAGLRRAGSGAGLRARHAEPGGARLDRRGGTGPAAPASSLCSTGRSPTTWAPRSTCCWTA